MLIVSSQYQYLTREPVGVVMSSTDEPQRDSLIQTNKAAPYTLFLGFQVFRKNNLCL